MKPWVYIFTILPLLGISISVAATPMSLCVLNHLVAPDQAQVAREADSLREAVQLLRSAPDIPLSTDEIQEVRKIEGIRSKSDAVIHASEVREFYRKKLENSVMVLDAEFQYRRAQQSAAALDVQAIIQIASDRLKNLGTEIRTPIREDFTHLADVIDGLRAGHGEEQNYSNEEIAEYLTYEAVSKDWGQSKINKDQSPEWLERSKQLEVLRKNLLDNFPQKLRRTSTLIGERVLIGCCHLGCGSCFFGSNRSLREKTGPWLFSQPIAQDSQLPLYKALGLVRSFIPNIDSANPDWIAGKNKNLR